MSDDLARVIDPHAFASWEGMVAHCLRTGDSQEDAERWATMTYGQNMDAAREKATAVRSYLLSEERVDHVALALVNFDQARLDMPTLASVEEFRRDDDRELYRSFARASLSAAMGGEGDPPR